MYKLLKTLTPIVLVLYCSTSTFATATYEEGQFNQNIKYKIFYGSIGSVLSDLVYRPRTDDKFTLNIKAFYKENEFKDIKLIDAGKFKSFARSEYRYGDFVFYLKAPSTIGTYVCTFEGTTYDNEKYSFAVPISIESQDKTTFLEKMENTITPIAIIAAIVIVLAMVILPLSQK